MKIIFFILLIFVCNSLAAQNFTFLDNGKIEFEKTVNIFGVIRQQIGKNPNEIMIKAVEEYKKTHPQFRKLKSNLIFNGGKSLYTPVSNDIDEKIIDLDNPIASQMNIVYNNLNTNETVMEKTIFGETYLIKDSLRKIKWKITDETREIAGYNCRRANGIMLDSIYVVAFYTNEIPLSIGPESFTGLPGMILGVAIPYENLTWFATKISGINANQSIITPPQKGKTFTFGQIKSVIEKTIENSPYKDYLIKGFLL